MTIKAYNGDCLKIIEEKINEKEVDIVITSPPYNLNKKYSLYNDKIAEDDYFEWIFNVSKSIDRVLKNDGSYFLNIGYQNLNPVVPFVISQRIMEIFKLQNTIIWAKSITVGNDSHGHFIPNNSSRYLNNIFEYVFHFTKDGNKTLDRNAIGVPYKDKRNIERFENNKEKGDVRCAGNVWFIPHKTIKSKQEKHNHPTTFPEELVKKCILLHGFNSSTVVMDPFAGVGTTAKVCKQMNLNSIAIEIDQSYYEIINKLI